MHQLESFMKRLQTLQQMFQKHMIIIMVKDHYQVQLLNSHKIALEQIIVHYLKEKVNLVTTGIHKI